MRLPFFHPRRDEIAATATELITRFGLRAHEEALYLAQLSAQMRSRRDRVIYELVAREIDASFAEAQRRLGLRQSAPDTAHDGIPLPKGEEGAEDRREPPKLGRPAPHIPSVSPPADIPTSLVANLNFATSIRRLVVDSVPALKPGALSRMSLGGNRRASYDGPFPCENTFGFRLVGVIGHYFFRPYAVTFDFETMQIFLQ
jgi:hypothetical protein